VTLLLTGLAYPLLMTGLAQALFPDQANGSLVSRDGQVWARPCCSGLREPGLLQPRPSAAGAATTGGLLGLEPRPDLAEAARARRADVERLKPRTRGSRPRARRAGHDLGQRLDPHVSPEAARWQAVRVPPPEA